MVFSKRIVQEKNQAALNVEEAYNLWDLINSIYFMIQQLNLILLFIHDKDLEMYFQRILKKRKVEALKLEKLLDKHNLNAPNAPRQNFNASANFEILYDMDAAHILLLFLQEMIELLLRAVRTATTNDDIRTVFINFTKSTIEDLDDYMKYLKLKGWLNQPPLYPNVPTDTKEQLDAGEAFHLWDHLTFRYDNILDTQIWYEYAHDGDFKTLLKVGLQATLKKQAEMLEKELTTFGIPLPIHPPNVVSSGNSTLFSDQHIFRNLYKGIVGAQWLHALVLKQCTTNDRLRGIFKNLLLSEIDILDTLIKFGKIKAWLNVVPRFAPVQ